MGESGTVVDIDAHFIDHLDEIYEYLDDDDPWKEKFRLGSEEEKSGVTSFFPKQTFNSYRAQSAMERSSFETKNDILNDMDKLGIDKILLIGQQLLRTGAIRADDKRPIKYAEAYMEYILDNIVDPDEGIYCTVPVVSSDPDWARRIIERYGDEKSVVGAVLVSSGGEPPYGNRRYDTVYEVCEKKGLPVMYHADSASLDDFHYHGFSTNLETHSLGFLIANMSQLTSVVVQGVPEKFPDLEFVFQEAGLFYVPMMMHRLDQEYLCEPDEAPLLDRIPSEYMKEFYYGTQPMEQPADDEHLEAVIDMIGGAERLMWASDWPHPDYDETTVINELPFLSRAEKRKVLGENAENIFDV
jgi:predicted TIM-barrel fold metal-dependent hydrolase